MMPFRREPETPADPSPEWNEHWAAVLGLPDPDPCLLCGRNGRAADCQQCGQVRELLGGWLPGIRPGSKPARTVVCKDCCIDQLEGHRCPWWDLCWPV